MIRTLKSERGMALALALGALVIIGVLAAGAMWAGTQDYRIAANTVRQTGAEATAELGVNRLLANWQTVWNTGKPIGDTLLRTYTMGGNGSAIVTATRLPNNFWWVVSEGQSGGPASSSARRRYGSLWRLNVPDMSLLGAITTQGSIKVSGNVNVNGNDSTPPGWPACASPQNVAGAAISPTTTATVSGSVTVNGNPPVLTTSAAGDSNTYFNYGGSNYQSLAQLANITIAGGTTLTGIAPVVASGVCNTTPQTNWGDPSRAVAPLPPGACESYFPIIHVTGDLHVSTGSGQGILLVDGSLVASGSFTFTGVVIVRGSLQSTGTGNKFVGSVMAAGVTVSDNSLIAGSSGIHFSCAAVNQVLAATAFPKQAMQRGWVDLY
jgi:hypothetical protein